MQTRFHSRKTPRISSWFPSRFSNSLFSPPYSLSFFSRPNSKKNSKSKERERKIENFPHKIFYSIEPVAGIERTSFDSSWLLFETVTLRGALTARIYVFLPRANPHLLPSLIPTPPFVIIFPMLNVPFKHDKSVSILIDFLFIFFSFLVLSPIPFIRIYYIRRTRISYPNGLVLRRSK